MTIQTPDWVKDAVFYQIYPDRFAKSPRTQHPKGIQFKPWGSPPEEQGYQGGDLLGIVDRMDYLQALGINAIYLNPIFASASNHRYHTYDYFQVDPLLGGNSALKELLDAAQSRKMRVILDGVFNHASRGFWAFHHILENGKNSPYLDWFIIHDWPLRPYSRSKKKPHNYDAWWGLPALPKFNTNTPGVRQYIFNVAQYWLEFGIDGWRLDVPEEIDDDSFWQEFRDTVKIANPEAYICGEIWGEAVRWLRGDQFDAVMNYRFTEAALNFFGAKTLCREYRKNHLEMKGIDASEFSHRINQMHRLYDWEVNHVQLNLLDSHDTARALWMLGGDHSALRLCVLFQMTMPGAPCIYYGDEIGMSSGDDPHCRAAFPWSDEDSWNQDLLKFYQSVITLRNQYPVLRRGKFLTLNAKGKCYAFHRKLDQQECIVIFNASKSAKTLALHLGKQKIKDWIQIWPSRNPHVYRLHHEKLKVHLPKREAVILTGAPTK